MICVGDIQPEDIVMVRFKGVSTKLITSPQGYWFQKQGSTADAETVNNLDEYCYYLYDMRVPTEWRVEDVEELRSICFLVAALKGYGFRPDNGIIVGQEVESIFLEINNTVTEIITNGGGYWLLV